MREMVKIDLPWIEQIPKEWSTKRMKEFLSERKETCLADDGYQLLAVSEYYGVAPKKDVIKEGEQETRAESVEGYKICHPGDLAMNIMLAWRRAMGVSDYLGIISPSYAVFQPKKGIQVNMKFFHYLFRTDVYAKYFEGNSTGIMASRWRLYPDVFLSLRCQFPPIDEQSRIVTFLDDRCAKIDEAIARHDALIKKLDEYRKGIITEAVTGGTFYNEETKDLPKGWTLCRIKNLLSPSKEGIKIGPFGSSLTGKVLGDAEYKVYGQWNIVGKDFSAGKNYVNEDTFKALSSYVVVEGDVLISMMGTIGKCTIIPSGIQPGIMDSHVIKARLNSLILPRFFEYEYDKDNSHYVYKQMLVNRTGSIMDGLNSTVVKNLHFILPPLAEQRTIVTYLDKKCAAIDAAKERHAQLMAKLEEYKKSLIYYAVTGKIEC